MAYHATRKAGSFPALSVKGLGCDLITLLLLAPRKPHISHPCNTLAFKLCSFSAAPMPSWVVLSSPGILSC